MVKLTHKLTVLAALSFTILARADEISKWQSSVTIDGPTELQARNGTGDLTAVFDPKNGSEWKLDPIQQDYKGSCLALSGQRSMPYAGEIVAQVDFHTLFARLPRPFTSDLFKLRISAKKVSTGVDEILLDKSVTPQTLDMYDFDANRKEPELAYVWLNRSFDSAPVELRVTTSEPTYDVQLSLCEITRNAEAAAVLGASVSQTQLEFYMISLSISQTSLDLRRPL